MPIKKYSKVKFTLRKELIIILAVIVVMVVTTILLLQPTKEQKFVNKWNDAGSSIVENNLFVEVDVEDLGDVIAKEGITYIFFASPSDTNAAAVFDKVNSLATTLEIEKIYIVDSAFAVGDREEDAELDAELTKIEEKYSSETVEVSLDTIDMWAFKDGKIYSEIDRDIVEANSSDYTEVIKRLLLLSK